MIALVPIRAVCLAVAMLASLLLLPATATAGYSSEAVPIAGPLVGGNSGLGDIAVDSSGGAMVVWTAGGTNEVAIRARRIHPDGTLGGVIDVTDGSTRALDAHIDFASNGRAIIGWVESAKFGDPQSVRARWIEPNDAMTEPITLRVGGTESEPGELDLSTTADDGAILAWHNFKSKPLFRIVEAAYISGGGAVSEPVLPTSGAGSLGVQVAPNSSGGSLMTWRDSGVEVQAFSPTGVPGSLQTPGPGIISDPKLATDGHDHFQLVYKIGFSPSTLVYHRVAADGSFEPAQELDPIATDPIVGFSIATNDADRSVATWARKGTEQTVKTRFIGAGGSPDPTTFSTPAGPAGGAPSVGIGGLGGVASAWIQQPSPEVEEVWGQIFPPGAGPGAPTLISSPGGDAGTPEVALAGGELGAVAWDERVGTAGPEPSFRVFVRQVLPPPSCPDGSGTVVQGRPLRISLNCVGLQLLAPAIVTGPAHGTVGEIDAATQTVLYTPQPGFDGTDSFRFQGQNRGGPEPAIRTVTVRVGRDTVRPRITRFSIGSPRKKKRKFTLRYSEAATATIAIERRRACRGKAGVSRRCKKFKKLGTLRAKRVALTAKVVLPKRVGGKRLRPGSYRATAIARDQAGNSSKPKRLAFSVASG